MIEEEQRPLLGPTHVPHNDVEIPLPTENNESHSPGEEERVTPLPMKQLSILLLMQLAEPMACTVI